MRYSATKAIWISALAAGLAVGLYLFWFVGVHELPLSTSTQDWGQFGSYMAGTAGVAFALATVWMLADTIKIQKDELKLSREEIELSRQELQKSADALESQVKLSTRSLEMEQNYYLLKSVDQNIHSICNQSINNRSDRGLIWKYENTSAPIPGNSNQIKSIVRQYMLIIGEMETQTHSKSLLSLIKLSAPVTYKYRTILNKAMDAGYFCHFNDKLLGQAKKLIGYENYVADKQSSGPYNQDQ